MMSHDPRQPTLSVVDTLAERYLKGKISYFSINQLKLPYLYLTCGI